MKHLHAFLLIVAIICVGSFQTLSAQIRTAYFMDKSIARTTLNPAFQAERSFVSIPGIGAFTLNAATDGLAINNLLYPDSEDKSLRTFLNSGQDPDKFLSALHHKNKLSLDLRTDIVQVGWRTGTAFWTVGAAIRGGFQATLPKDLFRFVTKAETGKYDMSATGFDVSAWVELSAGYSRPINDKLTVGGKFKFLSGLGAAKVTFDRFDATLSDDIWTANAEGTLTAALPGDFKFKEDEDDEFITGLEGGSFSPAGFGAAVDLGATYQLLDNLTLSASILDLGFISWGKSAYAKSSIPNGGMELNFEELNILDGGGADKFTEQTDKLMELAHFYPSQEEKSLTTMLATTVLLGGEYTFFENKLGAGLLSTTRFNPLGIYTELTASANYRPANWFAASLSYSAVHSNFKTFGLAINFSPKGLNFFLGSDYMLTKVTPQFLPVSATAANIHLGIAAQW
ncbi:MAG: DUF5723 family protein [Tannerellaceae bacterium]|jgi:hypothetical protein|nr:DUF5723 family protein [Tannerellaceae bacterium]